MAFPISTVVPVTAGSQALRTRSAAAFSPKKSSIKAADKMAAVGLALPVPTMSGAEPCEGAGEGAGEGLGDDSPVDYGESSVIPKIVTA